MDLRLLARFVAVAEDGSLNKAAARLNLSQPALSKSLQMLEERFAAPLMDRGPRGVTLTSFGDLLYRHAKWIEAEFRRLDGEMGALREVAIGEVRVGVPPGPGFISTILPAATLRLDRPESRITYSYLIGTRNALLRPLVEGELDFIVTTLGEDEAAADLVQEELFPERNTIVAAAGHKLAGHDRVALAELAGYSWAVLTEIGALETTLRAELQRQGVPHRRSVLRSNSSLFLKSILTGSDWIGLINQDAIGLEVEAGLFSELRFDPAEAPAGIGAAHPIGICYRRNATLSTASTMLIREIKAACARRGAPGLDEAAAPVMAPATA